MTKSLSVSGRAMSEKLSPGYLHLDVRCGLKADMINASLNALIGDEEMLKKVFDDAGLSEISLVSSKSTARGIKGSLLHLYHGGQLIEPLRAKPYRAQKCSISGASPIWHGDGTDAGGEGSQRGSTEVDAPVQPSCLMGEFIDIAQIERFFRGQKKLDPAICHMAIHVLSHLHCPHFQERKLDGLDGLWLLCHLLMLCAQITILDPKFITASDIYVKRRPKPLDLASSLKLNDDLWLDHVSTGIAVCEIEDDRDIDVLALAFLKAISSSFGPRAQGTITRVSIGISGHSARESLGFVESLWCEAKMPKSMVEHGLSNQARATFKHQISGLVSATTDMIDLSSALSLHGALKINWHLVQGERNVPLYRVEFHCSDDDLRESVEAFLIKGQAFMVCTNVIESHEMNRRLVCVPMGSGNKVWSARFYEYIYYDKTVRVEPLAEDLDEYVKKTCYSVDVARSDLLMAWKKWRGRIAKEVI